MGKIAFLFVGQGSQRIGMGKELYDNFPVVKETFLQMNEYLHMDMSSLIFEGDKEDLDLTVNTQPAIVGMSIAIHRVLQSFDIVPELVAGLSLGEYSALTASGVFTLEQVIPLVRKRGCFMQESVPVGQGKMSAILNLSEELMKEACVEGSQYGIVEIANYNCPGQIVIGGEIEAVNMAGKIAKELGAFRVIDLPVSAPFHTSMLEPASIKLKGELDLIDIDSPRIPFVSNVTSLVIDRPDHINDLLCKQVKQSVLWEQSIKRMIDLGIEHFIEIGPGKVLSGFMKKIDRSVKVSNVEDMKSLEATLQSLKP